MMDVHDRPATEDDFGSADAVVVRILVRIVRNEVTRREEVMLVVVLDANPLNVFDSTSPQPAPPSTKRVPF